MSKDIITDGGRVLANKLDINIFNNGIRCIEVGKLTNEIIQFLNLQRSPGSIVLWDDRLEYIEKHKADFKTEEDYYRHILEIPNIIEKPDYLGLHPKDNSIQFIKRIDEIMLVGVRIKNIGSLSIRSSYPISQDQLNHYIASNTAWKFK